MTDTRDERADDMSFLIRDLTHLTALASRPEGVECFIVLGGGIGRSTKQIRYIAPRPHYHVGQYDVCNEIDGSWQTLWPKQLWTQSNIGIALERGALFAQD